MVCELYFKRKKKKERKTKVLQDRAGNNFAWKDWWSLPRGGKRSECQRIKTAFLKKGVMKSFREREWHIQKYSFLALEIGRTKWGKSQETRRRQARSWSISVLRTLLRRLNFVLYKDCQICGTWQHFPVCTSGRHNYYATGAFSAELRSGLNIYLHTINPPHSPGAPSGSH